MKKSHWWLIKVFVATTTIGLASWALWAPRAQSPVFPKRVILVTLDGLRWQEVFRGADRELLSIDAARTGQGAKRDAAFWRDTPEERRRVLMPFLWDVVAKEGLILGDPSRGGDGRVANGKNFSYPGYNELLSGTGDARITSNDPIANPNVTVLESLARRPDLKGRIAAFGSWKILSFILNRDRSGLPLSSGWEPLGELASNDQLRLLDHVTQGLPRIWSNVRYDALTTQIAIAYAKAHDTRLLYVALGETDERAHEDQYGLYLEAARRNDAFLATLWRELAPTPENRRNTTLIITTDHGRGATPDDWQKHGTRVPESARIWLGAMGRGVTSGQPETPFTLGQVAATVAKLFDEDWRKTRADAAPPLPGIAD